MPFPNNLQWQHAGKGRANHRQLLGGRPGLLFNGARNIRLTLAAATPRVEGFLYRIGKQIGRQNQREHEHKSR